MKAKNTDDPKLRVADPAVSEVVCTLNALRAASRQLGNLYDEVLAPSNLKATQIALLDKIDRLAGREGSTLQNLANELAIGISALTHALRPLMRDGIVELRPNQRDRRIKHALLTASGRARLEEGLSLWSAAHQRAEAVLGPASASLLRALAERVSSKDFLAAFKSDSVSV